MWWFSDHHDWKITETNTGATGPRQTNNKNIAEGTRGPFYTIGRSSLPTAETLERRRRRRKNVIPKAQHLFCTMV